MELFKERRGRFVVQVALNFLKGDSRLEHDPEPIRPYMSYDGKILRDLMVTNCQHVLTEADRESEETARAVFRGIYKGLKVYVENVYLID